MMKKLLILAPLLLIGFDAEGQTTRPGQSGWVNTGARRGYCYTFRMSQCGGGPVAWSRREGTCVCRWWPQARLTEGPLSAASVGGLVIFLIGQNLLVEF